MNDLDKEVWVDSKIVVYINSSIIFSIDHTYWYIIIYAVVILTNDYVDNIDGIHYVNINDSSEVYGFLYFIQFEIY